MPLRRDRTKDMFRSPKLLPCSHTGQMLFSIQTGLPISMSQCEQCWSVASRRWRPNANRRVLGASTARAGLGDASETVKINIPVALDVAKDLVIVSGMSWPPRGGVRDARCRSSLKIAIPLR